MNKKEDPQLVELAQRVRTLRQSKDSYQLANALRELGEFERRFPAKRADVLRHYQEAVELFRSCDDHLRLAHTVRHLGNIYHEDGDMDAAGKCLTEAINIYHNNGDRKSLDYANAIRSLAALKDDINDLVSAKRLWIAARDLYIFHRIEDGVNETGRRIKRIEEMNGT